MEYREAVLDDLEKVIDNRMEFVTSIREISDIEGFRKDTTSYLKEHLCTDDLVVFIALDREKIISSCMACIFTTIPLPSCPTGKSAELLNVYTLQEYRRKGHSEKLLRLLLTELKERNVKKVILDYTDDGFPLYKKLGFEAANHKMLMRL